MLSDEVQRIMLPKRLKANATVIEKIKYLEGLEQRGIIEPTTPQTAYKYPLEILLNGRKLGCKTR
jgi:hypothetical protein